MKLSGRYDFEAPVAVVWPALLDPVVLAAVMPGCDKLEQVDGIYVGKLNVKVGPVQGTFEGKVKLADVVEAKGYNIDVDGRGSQGYVKATGSVELTPQATTQTRVDYDVDVRVGGRIASVGQRLIEASAKAIINESLDSLNRNVKARANTGAGEKTQVIEADQTDFAKKVAKEVAREMIPPTARYVLIVLSLASAAALVYWLAR